MAESDVQLWIYDLSGGSVKSLSQMLIGRQIDGIWHTSTVVHGEEIFFGAGVQRAVPGTTPFGQPLQKLDMGTTSLDEGTYTEIVADLSARYQPQHYSLLTNNCNHFSNELCELLCGKGVPAWVLNQADEVFNTPLGQMLMPVIMQMEGQLGGATASGFGGGSAGATGGAPGGTAPPPR